MDYDKACKILGLVNTRGNQIYLTHSAIRKAYYKRALLSHPDKHCLNNRKIKHRSKQYSFADIQNAYEFLLNHLEISQGIRENRKHTNDKYTNDKYTNGKYATNTKKRTTRHRHYTADNLKHADYFSIFVSFVKMISPTIIDRWGPEYIQSTLKNLFTTYGSAVIPELFLSLSKERAIELYDFIVQYREYINISDQTMMKARSIVQEKMSADNLILLNPSLKQMWGDELYRLDFMTREYLIPLWWPEITFQKQDDNAGNKHNCYATSDVGDLRVKMIPDLPPSVFIDRGNNIHLTKQYDMAAMRHVLDDAGEFTVSLLDHTYKVPKEKIRFVEERQIILLGEDGLLPLNKKNMYDTSVRKSVFCHLFLTST